MTKVKQIDDQLTVQTLDLEIELTKLKKNFTKAISDPNFNFSQSKNGLSKLLQPLLQTSNLSYSARQRELKLQKQIQELTKVNLTQKQNLIQTQAIIENNQLQNKIEQVKEEVSRFQKEDFDVYVPVEHPVIKISWSFNYKFDDILASEWKNFYDIVILNDRYYALSTILKIQLSYFLRTDAIETILFFPNKEKGLESYVYLKKNNDNGFIYFIEEKKSFR